MEEEDQEQPKEGGSSSKKSENSQKQAQKAHCKSCGRDDHSRRSSAKCPNHIPFQKKLFDDGIEKETFSRKCGTRKLIKSTLLYNKIQIDVDAVSALMVETSIYLNFMINKNPNLLRDNEKEPDLLLYFYQLKDNTKKSISKIDAEYQQMRKQFNIPPHEGKYRSYLIQGAAKSLQTCFKNNISVHMYQRLRRFFKTRYKEKSNNEIFQILEHIFENNDEEKPIEVKEFRTKFEIQELNFKEVENKWWKFIPFMIRLQKHFIAEKVKSFKVVPLFTFGRKHLLYTRDALYEILASLGIKTSKNNSGDSAENMSLWNRYFNLEKHLSISKNISFGGSITTNGIDTSIHLRRPNHKPKANGDQEKLKTDFKNGVYSEMCGIDPGLRYMVGMVSLHQDGTHTNKLVSNTKFRHGTGEFRRRRKLRNMTKEAKEFNLQSVDFSSKNEDFIEFTKFQLKYFIKMQKLYARRQVAKLKWEKTMQVRSAVDKLADDIINSKNHEGKTLIAFGNGQTGPCIKGYTRVPQKGLLEALKRKKDKCTVVMVDEFRTTKLCSKCFKVCITSKSPHRFEVCPHCKLTWNRDINGANNILKKLICQLLDLKLHINLQRGTKLSTL